MNNELSLRQQASYELVPAAEHLVSDIQAKGHYVVEHWRDGKRINEYRFKNDIVNEGKLKLLGVMFHGVAAIATWYLGIIANTGYTALAATDNYDNINQAGNGWDEFASYTIDPGGGANATIRGEWVEGDPSGNAISNPSPTIFTITADATIKGVFLVGGPEAGTKSDHTAGNTLWATALFSSDVQVRTNDVLKVTYSVSA